MYFGTRFSGGEGSRMHARSDDALEHGWQRQTVASLITSEKRTWKTFSFWPSICASSETETAVKFPAFKKSCSWLSWTKSFSALKDCGSSRVVTSSYEILVGQNVQFALPIPQATALPAHYVPAPLRSSLRNCDSSAFLFYILCQIAPVSGLFHNPDLCSFENRWKLHSNVTRNGNGNVCVYISIKFKFLVRK